MGAECLPWKVITEMTNTEFDRWLHLISQPSRILLVEDDRNFVELISHVSQRYNCQVEVAESVEQASGRLRQSRFDLLLLDFKLPGHNGLDLLRRIFATGVKVPIVILSGYITTQVVEEARQLGLVAFIAKPTADVIDQLHGLFHILGIKERVPSGE